jgi:hypothetical protein
MRIWKWGTVLYGLMQTMNLMILIGFMFVELPQFVTAYVKEDPRMDKFFEKNTYIIIIGFGYYAFIHILPCAMSLYEFQSSCIKLSWYHFPFHCCFLTLYLIFLQEWDYATKVTLYLSIDWNERPLLSSAIVVFFIDLYFLCFLAIERY